MKVRICYTITKYIDTEMLDSLLDEGERFYNFGLDKIAQNEENLLEIVDFSIDDEDGKEIYFFSV